MGNITLRVAEEKDRDSWDKIVRENHGTIYHLWDWLKIMEKHSKHGYLNKVNPKLITLMAYLGDSPFAIFPIYFFNSFPRYVFSPPPDMDIFYLGPVFPNLEKYKQNKAESYLEEFYSLVDEYTNRLNPAAVKISTTPDIIDCRQLKWLGYEVEPFYDYITDLSLGEEEIWNSFHVGFRKNIRHAKKKGIVIEESRLEDFEFVYDSINERLDDQNVSFRFEHEYMADIFEKFYPENIKVFTAEYEGKKIGGIIFTCFNKEVSFWIGTSKSKMSGIYPNEILIWESILWAINNGFDKFRMIGANISHLNKFKSRFNPDVEMYFSGSKFYSVFSLLHQILNLRSK